MKEATATGHEIPSKFLEHRNELCHLAISIDIDKLSDVVKSQGWEKGSSLIQRVGNLIHQFIVNVNNNSQATLKWFALHPHGDQFIILVGHRSSNRHKCQLHVVFVG